MKKIYLDKRTIVTGKQSNINVDNPFNLTGHIEEVITSSVSTTGAENGTFISGGNVRLGGPLVQNTTITEDGFNHENLRTEDPAGNGNVTTNYNSYIGSPLVRVGDFLVRSFMSTDSTSNSECGVGSDADSGSFAFLAASDGVNESVVNSFTDGINLQNILSNTTMTQLQLNNSAINKLAPKEVTQFTFQSLPSRSIISSEIPITEVVAPGATYTYTIPINVNTYMKIQFNGVYIEGGVQGIGIIETKGGAGKKALIDAVNAVMDSEDIRVTPGLTAVTTEIIAFGTTDVLLKITNNAVEDNMQFSGILQIIQTTTTVS